MEVFILTLLSISHKILTGLSTFQEFQASTFTTGTVTSLMFSCFSVESKGPLSDGQLIKKLTQKKLGTFCMKAVLSQL